MATLNTKLRLGFLETKLLPKEIIPRWWVIHWVSKNEPVESNYATCDEESYSREKGETEEDFIERVKAVPREPKYCRVMSVTTRP